MFSSLPDNKVPWGLHLTIVVTSNVLYWPSFVALFNSAYSNGFEGRFLLSALEEGVLSLAKPHLGERLSVRLIPDRYLAVHTKPAVLHLENVLDLPDGDFLYLDLDVMIERPLGDIIAPLKDGILFNIQPYWDLFPESVYPDCLYYRQCQFLGIKPADGPPTPYLNGGFCGFRYPRDREWMTRWAEISLRTFSSELEDKHLRRKLFVLLEQDILNVLLFTDKATQKCPLCFFVTSDQLEFGGNGSRHGLNYWNRPFPYALQNLDLHANFIIHGGAIRRPWLYQMKDGFRPWLYRTGLGPWIRRYIKNNLTPYERAWFYYATLNENGLICMDSWVQHYPRFASTAKRLAWAHLSN